LMTLFLEHAVALSGEDASVRLSRILSSTLNLEEDAPISDKARILIGGESIDLDLLRQAVAQEEYDFLMVCIGGHFVSWEDVFNSYAGADVSDIHLLRFYSAKKDRDMVRFLHAKIRENTPITRNRAQSQIGNRDLEYEREDTRDALLKMLKPARPITNPQQDQSRQKYSFLRQFVSGRNF